MTVHVPIMASRDEDRALRTLIVDDSVVVRTVIERILNADRRFSVTHKTNSAEHALGYLQDHEVDLILLDIELPGQSGRSEEHTSELQSLMRISYAVFCLKKIKIQQYS